MNYTHKYSCLFVYMLFLCIQPAFALPDGWSQGQVATGTDMMLEASEPFALDIPVEIATLVTKPTGIYYFSPTCPHCQAVIPEIVELSKDFSDVQWIGIASSHSSPDMIEAFKQAYGVDFPILHDSEGLFSQAVGARATPNVYVVKPDTSADTGGESVLQSPSSVLLTDMYLPYTRGLAGVFKLRNGASGNPFEHFEGYQGNRVCMSCHVEEGKSYLMTHHAQAYYTLYKVDKVDDPKCVSCHVVGLGEETGFQLGDHASPLVGVGCESCHSASGGHDGKSVDAKASCVGCHDAEHSIHFSVEKGLPHIDHFAATGMSDAEIRKRVDAISDGTAEKPLLAFPKGETVGSERCLTCHEGTHPNDPHRNAMSTLSRKQRKSTKCLQCHATPKEMSSMMSQTEQTPEHFWLKEGAGCESCHGAGGEHVAAPSKENIVGLGDSCPVCILESMCTSCHTPKWDPNWNLDERMKFYRQEQ